MVEVITVVAYVLTFGIPSLILGYGSIVNENKATSILAYVNMMALLVYFHHIGVIGTWIIILVFIILSLLFGILFKGVLNGN